ncbi:glycosyltransferase family 4 protein [Patulibacter defluvii]|uniref:glycosyltransferase family 4 protein n=1 Tax=Patulibacter defluvii TaxID=3095358 RepID=UPI0035C8BAB0
MTLRVAFDARDARQAERRGWGRYAAELLAALRRRDDVAIGAHGGGGRLPELAWEQVGWPARLALDPPDLLHAPNCFLPLVRPCPGVVTVHDLAFEVHRDDFAPRTGWKYRTVTRRAVASAEAVICVSQATADDVCERYGTDPARIHVVPNAPSLAQGSPDETATGDGDERPYLLAIGDLRAKKNLGRLLVAWERSGLEQRLVLVGTGAEGTELGRRLRARGAELPGYLPDGELDALLRGADLLVHPSLFEGFGLVLLEAMARGVPVACSDIPSLRETAGGAAELFDPTDVADIVRGLHDALGRRDALAAAGLKRASSFSWDRTAARTLDVYRSVVP